MIYELGYSKYEEKNKELEAEIIKLKSENAKLKEDLSKIEEKYDKCSNELYDLYFILSEYIERPTYDDLREAVAMGTITLALGTYQLIDILEEYLNHDFEINDIVNDTDSKMLKVVYPVKIHMSIGQSGVKIDYCNLTELLEFIRLQSDY